MLYRWLFAFFCVFAAPARAESVSVALPSGSLDLPIPDGYCVLTKANPNERALIELQERMQSGINRVLVFAAPCTSIGAVRDGHPITEYAIWFGIYSNGAFRRVSPTHSLQAYIDEMARTYPRLDVVGLSREMANRGRDQGLDMSLQRVGVIDRDQNAIYLGRANSVRVAGGRPVAMAGVTAITLADRYPVSFNLYRKFAGENTLDELRVGAQEIARRHIAHASGGDGLVPVATGFEDDDSSGLASGLVVAFALLGGAFGVGVVVMLSRRFG